MTRCIKNAFLIHEKMHDVYWLYSTPTKTWESVDVAEFRPYMWSGYEQGRENVGYKILSLACAEDVTALGRK